jgi:2-polyprenyl-3-methyl-5-hydroxy-6-metoxy-1,4-benzoquinol methylase
LERKGCKRVATTTEAEIEEKRLQLNAERTIKQNKAAAAILKHYLFQKKMDIEFEEFDVVKLDEVLEHFYMGIRTGL